MKSVLKAGYEFDQLLVLGILQSLAMLSFKMWFLFAYFWVRNRAMLEEKKER